MRTLDRIIPIIVILLVGLLGYLLYNNKYNQVDYNIELTKNNLDMFFELSKNDIEKEYGNYDYEYTYSDKIGVTYCYKSIERCFKYDNKNKVDGIILHGGNKKNKIDKISANDKLEKISQKYKLEVVDKIEADCISKHINHKIKDYDITYSTKIYCDDTDITNIDYILIIENVGNN